MTEQTLTDTELLDIASECYASVSFRDDRYPGRVVLTLVLPPSPHYEISNDLRQALAQVSSRTPARGGAGDGG